MVGNTCSNLKLNLINKKLKKMIMMCLNQKKEYKFLESRLYVFTCMHICIYLSKFYFTFVLHTVSEYDFEREVQRYV